jgi:hypothetical protein
VLKGETVRKALIPAFLLVLGAVVLGSTVFREQLVQAATTPFQNVLVQNTNTNPVPVQQVGTSTTSVSGTVGIDSSKNTVKLDSSGNTVKLDSNANTVNLDSTDSSRLANIESALGNLKFDSSGELATTAQPASPGAVTEHCIDEGLDSGWSVPNDSKYHTLCTEDFYVTDIAATGMDDNIGLQFYYQGNLVLDLEGSSNSGSDSYQLDLTHPLHIDGIAGVCGNASTDCNFNLVLLGNSTGN